MSRGLAAGAALYALAAYADLRLTLEGTGGRPSLEGNPIIAEMMIRLGPAGGLWTEKILVGAVCAAVAAVGAPAMRRRAPWLDRIPSTRWARAWVKSGDRSWMAYVPLYGAALGQLAAAGSWIWLR